MPSSRPAPIALSFWLLGMEAGLAADAPAPAATEPSAWSTLGAGAPVLFGAVVVLAVVVAALLGQLAFALQEKRVAPRALLEALTRAIQSGNYQEAWEVCNRWRQTALARILQPSLERIGQGRAVVESRLADEERHERDRIFLLVWVMAAAAAAAVILSLLAIGRELGGVAAFAMSPDGPRAAALAAGNAVMLAALAVAVAVPAAVGALWLRVRAARLLRLAGEQGLLTVASLPYEEIEGVRIGSDFHAGTLLGDEALSQTGRLQVSKELTTLCPTCNGPINSSRPSCAHCGQLLAWS